MQPQASRLGAVTVVQTVSRILHVGPRPPPPLKLALAHHHHFGRGFPNNTANTHLLLRRNDAQASRLGAVTVVQTVPVYFG